MFILTAIVFAFIHAVSSQSCGGTINLNPNVPSSISSPNYPNYYGSSPFTCKWTFNTPAGYIVAANCYVEVPNYNNCARDRLEFSRLGYTGLDDAERYCGTIQNLQIDSIDNKLVVALTVPQTSAGGRFTCNMGAVLRTCSCGIRNRGTRIVGGTPTLVNEFPMMAGLVDMNSEQLYCGGTIISSTAVLTAAHCLTSMSPSTVSILVGDHDISIGSESPYSKLYSAHSFVIHDGYNQNLKQNDVALVRTLQVMSFNHGVSPACLPYRYKVAGIDNVNLDALGWGTTSFGGPTAKILQKVSLKVTPQTQCSSQMPNVIPQQFCTFTSGKDSCQNDSGGPLLYTDARSIVYVFGVINYGVGCASNYPSVNSKVMSYLRWIEDHTSNLHYCGI